MSTSRRPTDLTATNDAKGGRKAAFRRHRIEVDNPEFVPMPDFKTVKNPKTLKGASVDADHEHLQGGVDSAIGLDTPEGKPDAQLDIRYRGGRTFVSLSVDDGNGRRVPQEHWRFVGLISPEDCRTNWKAAQEKAMTPALSASKKATDDQPDD